MSATITIAGTLEAVGKTILGDVGVEIRTADKRLVIIPGLSTDQVRQLAAHLYSQVSVSIEVTP